MSQTYRKNLGVEEGGGRSFEGGLLAVDYGKWPFILLLACSSRNWSNHMPVL